MMDEKLYFLQRPRSGVQIQWRLEEVNSVNISKFELLFNQTDQNSAKIKHQVWKHLTFPHSNELKNMSLCDTGVVEDWLTSEILVIIRINLSTSPLGSSRNIIFAAQVPNFRINISKLGAKNTILANKVSF